MQRFWGAAAVFLLAVLSGGWQASGQTTKQEIAARLVGQPLYLRGMWAADDMKFEADGRPQTAIPAVPFTEAGINVRSVKLKGGMLVIEGQRMALEFLPNDTIRRVPAEAGGYNGKMKLEIASDASGDYGKALDAIFTSDLTSLIPSLPPYWQRYAKENFCKLTLEKKQEKKPKQVPADATVLNATGQGPCLSATTDALAGGSKTEGGGNAKTKHVGASVKPPRVLKSFNPTFTQLARTQRYSGNVEVYLIIGRDGSVSHVAIQRPVGLGLDEEAVAAVERYQFAPATQDGNPVAVDVYIDVNFKIF